MHKNTHKHPKKHRHHTRAYQTLQVDQILFITEHILADPAIINNHKKMSQKTSDNTRHKKDANGSMHQTKTS
jgi:hypothetical protein